MRDAVMTIPNPNPRIFVPGKIIQVRGQENPLIVIKLVLLSVEEHIRHVVEMLEWLYPDATPTQKIGARLHDVGKKVGARGDFLRGHKFTEEMLRSDFFGIQGDSYLSPHDSGQKYLAFAQDNRHRRLWPIWDEAKRLQDVRMDLDPPFGNHAADATEKDVCPYKDGSSNLEHNSEARDYILNLIRLHHSFQPDRIIDACAQHGEGMVVGLYRLIVADHMGSRWAEYVVQNLEAGVEKLEHEDFFCDVEVSAVGVPLAQGDRNGQKVGVIRLRRDKTPDEQRDLLEKELEIQYYPIEVNWDLKLLVEETKKIPDRKSPKRATVPRRRRSRRP